HGVGDSSFVRLGITHQNHLVIAVTAVKWRALFIVLGVVVWRGLVQVPSTHAVPADTSRERHGITVGICL
ncbi:hypothetical protein, partial [Pseudomonas viridiflava]|uniref:hypothetical protein n=1 Tax=Pseudomonas viridiflava TaxID=33069 RepID=UPI00197FFDC5